MNFFSATSFLCSSSGLEMVLGSVDCPTAIRCTAVFALRKGKFSLMLRGATHPHTPLRFTPANSIYAEA